MNHRNNHLQRKIQNLGISEKSTPGFGICDMLRKSEESSNTENGESAGAEVQPNFRIKNV